MKWHALYLLLGCLFFTSCQTTRETIEDPAIPLFFLEVPVSYPNQKRIYLPLSQTELSINALPCILESDLANVELVQVEMGLCLLFEFTPEGQKLLHRLTAANLGRRLVLTINGAPVGVRVIDRLEGSGQWLTFTELPEAELPGVVQRLKATIAALQKETRQR